MYLKLLDVDKFVELNKLKQITDPIYMQFKHPTPEGLFSTEIFGITQYDRQSIWAYIDLGEKFLHPLAAINFRRYGSTYENIIYGLKKYRLEDGNFIEDEVNGDTGIDFLYECYDKIKWKETSSLSATERIDFLSQGKDKIFLTKFPVCPPFYRDINDNSSIGVATINDMYKKLIINAQTMKQRGSFSFFGNMTRANVQKLLIQIFEYYTSRIKGKYGLMRKSVMGHSVDYGAWGVLSSPIIDCEKYDQMPVDFDHMGIPLPMILSMFKPFILHEAKAFFADLFVIRGKYTHYVYNKETKKFDPMLLDLEDPLGEYTDDFIDKQVVYYIKGYSTRFDPIPLPKNKQEIKDNIKMSIMIDGVHYMRDMTWTDLFFIISETVTEGKSVMWSRYPIEHFYSVEYPLIRVLSTVKTIKATVDGKEYSWYPVVNVGQDSSALFCETLVPNNVNIISLGADYDGDSTPVRGLFTAESNIDAEHFRRDKKNFLNLLGENIRPTEKDFIQTIYSMTKSTRYVELEDPN